MTPQICIKPISINAMFQGKRFRTSAYKSWQDNVCWQLPKVKMITGWIEISITYYVKNYGMTDVDNLNKGFLDCLTKRGYYEDDRKIVKLICQKVQVKDENKQGIDFEIKLI